MSLEHRGPSQEDPAVSQRRPEKLWAEELVRDSHSAAPADHTGLLAGMGLAEVGALAGALGVVVASDAVVVLAPVVLVEAGDPDQPGPDQP